MGSISEIGAAIIEAAASGDLNQLRAIRNKADDISEYQKICDEYSDFTTGRNVLHHAVEIGHFEICKFLIKTVKVYIDALTYKGASPLSEAVKGEHVKIVKFLINQGADISLSDVEGFTPLHYAVLKDNMEVMKLLKGAWVEAVSAGGTPLQIAVSRGNVQAVKCLLSHGADPSGYCAAVDTPLTCAVKSRSFECLKLLLAREQKRTTYLTELEAQGMQDTSYKQYRHASLVYRMASLLDPANPTWISKRSLLLARADESIFALLDAQEYIRLKPDFPVSHPQHTGDIAAAANQIFKKFLMAGLAFSLDPYNEAMFPEFRVAMFDYFASFSQMSSPDVILSFS
ncbi:ankyrin-1-like isoform X5 [Salvia hispanica]|uniref:ankyrin-1-like isoform X5 n=1 Tax=Salvia hispanica TaxID=49212 RepID=UPI00200940D2|nr:ankyrin-1-like isoform X5 [Salvia hispanica]